jgi:mannose-6-phosphate isomerase-like protein (cupin superfamily)
MTDGSVAGRIASGEDRFGTPARFLNGRFDCKVSATDTGGGLVVFDTFRDRVGGPPLHYHCFQDEWFMVLEGRFLFRLGETYYLLGPGDSILGPRMLPHAFRTLTVPARMLIAYAPGRDMEAFFQAGLGPDSADTTEFEELHLRHDIINVGPPLTDAEVALAG